MFFFSAAGRRPALPVGRPSGRLPDARFETLFPDGIQRKQRDGMALFGEVPRRRRAVDAAAEAQQYVFSHTE